MITRDSRHSPAYWDAGWKQSGWTRNPKPMPEDLQISPYGHHLFPGIVASIGMGEFIGVAAIIVLCLFIFTGIDVISLITGAVPKTSIVYKVFKTIWVIVLLLLCVVPIALLFTYLWALFN